MAGCVAERRPGIAIGADLNGVVLDGIAGNEEAGKIVLSAEVEGEASRLLLLCEAPAVGREGIDIEAVGSGAGEVVGRDLIAHDFRSVVVDQALCDAYHHIDGLVKLSLLSVGFHHGPQGQEISAEGKGLCLVVGSRHLDGGGGCVGRAGNVGTLNGERAHHVVGQGRVRCLVLGVVSVNQRHISLQRNTHVNAQRDNGLGQELGTDAAEHAYRRIDNARRGSGIVEAQEVVARLHHEVGHALILTANSALGTDAKRNEIGGLGELGEVALPDRHLHRVGGGVLTGLDGSRLHLEVVEYLLGSSDVAGAMGLVVLADVAGVGLGTDSNRAVNRPLDLCWERGRGRADITHRRVIDHALKVLLCCLVEEHKVVGVALNVVFVVGAGGEAQPCNEGQTSDHI